MSIHIELHQEKTVLEGPLYEVVTTIEYIEGLDRNIFVYETETGEYSHVATVWDMAEWPASQREAQLDFKNYYRDDSATVSYPVPSVARDAAAYIQSRVQSLAAQSVVSEDAFVGSETITIDEGEE